MSLRNRPALATFAIGGLLAGGAAAAAGAAGPSADLILTHGHVRGPGGWVEALAVRDGVIVALGSAAEVGRVRGAGTRVVELNNATVLPGLHDVHVHPMFAGLSEMQCKIAQGSSLEATLKRVGECAARAGAGEWIVGGQWDVSALGRVPDRTALDSVSAGHPVVLDDTSGHSAWANSKALTLAGITRATPNPTGGIIERDAAGEATGILREDAASTLVKAKVPRPTPETLRRALDWATREMLSYGVTSYTEAAVGFVSGASSELEAYKALADAGTFKPRATLCITWGPGSEEAEAAIASRNLYASSRISPSCVKIFLDGVPIDGHTAAMLQPYAGVIPGREDEAARMGMLLVKQDALDAAVTRFDRMGLTVKFHAAGDAAVRAGLNSIAAARAANGYGGLMHNVGHCTFVSPADIARARSIGATFEVSPYLWSPSPISDDIETAVGPEIIKRVWPVRELIESGALVVPGSDWSVVPSVNPWIGIETLVTREQPGGSSRSFGKTEAISVEQALDLFTVNAARQERTSDRLGRIDIGMLADLIVLDRNPYEVPAKRIHDTKVRMTFIGGEKVYEASSKPAAARP
jgi:predicted amidohydrolase YtcJ